MPRNCTGDILIINVLSCLVLSCLIGDFINTLFSYSFQPHILQPIHITSHSASLIDNIFFNSLENVTYSGNIVFPLTDHLPNFLSIDSIQPLPSNDRQFKRDFLKPYEEALISDFQHIDWPNLFHGMDNINDIFYCFITKSSEIINSHVPLGKLSRKEIKFRSKPWITPGIRTSINTKNRLHRKLIRTRNQCLYAKYKPFRHKLNHLIKISKKLYFEDFFRYNKSNIKIIWKGIKQIVALKPEAYIAPSKIVTSSNKVLTNTNDIANEFNHYFANIGNTLGQAIPRADTVFTNFLFKPLSNSLVVSHKPGGFLRSPRQVDCINL